ncbi:MAG: iron-containing alcohol dehydrogenase [Thermoproteales archaeon]|nr:iron-containing alcohol dehydrogenase [Thermoproteales archaeon]
MVYIEYGNPVKLVFGKGVLNKLGEEAKMHGSKALIVTSKGGSMKRYGYLDRASKSLERHGVRVTVYAGHYKSFDKYGEGGVGARCKGGMRPNYRFRWRQFT